MILDRWTRRKKFKRAAINNQSRNPQGNLSRNLNQEGPKKVKKTEVNSRTKKFLKAPAVWTGRLHCKREMKP